MCGILGVDDPRGHFDLGGNAPRSSALSPGWFGDTLAQYTLVVNLDADLSGSMKMVLDRLSSHIVVGTHVYFDEFSNRYHELRVFAEPLDRTSMHFRAVTRAFSNVAFQRTG